MTADVQLFINKLGTDMILSKYIVENKLFNFWKLLIEFTNDEQVIILKIIEDTYSNATGYGGFSNYDIFGTMAYNFILNTSNGNSQIVAFSILKGCSSYRYSAANLLDEIKFKFPNLVSV